MADRYVIVNEESKTILDGPFLWDGETEWEPPTAGERMLEAKAIEEGYTRVDDGVGGEPQPEPGPAPEPVVPE